MLKFLIALNASIFLFSVSACAGLIVFKYNVVDDELKSYVADYKQLLEKNCPQGGYKDERYVIQMEDELDESAWIGVCTRLGRGFHIAIKRSWWNKANLDERTQLMYHELAHCMIDREHDKSTSHYMYAYFYEMPRDMYTAQAVEDIQNYCSVRK